MYCTYFRTATKSACGKQASIRVDVTHKGNPLILFGCGHHSMPIIKAVRMNEFKGIFTGVEVSRIIE